MRIPKEINKLPIVRITYYDHCWLKEGQKLEDIKKKGKPAIIFEFGYLIKETNNCYIIGNGLDYIGESNDWSFPSSTVIMKSNVIKVEKLYIK